MKMRGQCAVEPLEDRTHLSAHAAGRSAFRLSATTGLGMFTLLDTTPPIVQLVRINDGAAQRSTPQTIDLTFSEPTNLPALISSGAIANCVQLYDKAAPSTPLPWLNATRFRWNSSTNQLSIDLTSDGFGGAGTGMLSNGRYELHIDVAQIIDASGNRMIDSDGRADGQLCIDRSTGAHRQDLYRLAGDIDGDGDVDLSDLGILATAYQASAAGDCDGDGDTDLSDLGTVSSHYGTTLPIAYAPPIVITRGGTYSGEWESLDANVAAVAIRTAEPVVIQYSTVRGKDDLIRTETNLAHVTVSNTRGYGMNPGVAGQAPGRFIKAERFRHVAVEHNRLEGTAGIYLFDYRGNRAGETIRIIGNDALNIDGRRSDGNGGWMNFNERVRISDGKSERGYDRVQFAQLNGVKNVPGIEIAWNQVINEPGNSRVEDNISIYQSSGTASSPIDIHDNYIRGAYTIQPWQADTADATWNYDWGYAGGGIMLGDGGDSAYAVAHDNQVISTTNYGIAIYGGHDMLMRANRVLSCGLLADGRAITAQNVGIYIWDAAGSGPDNFYNNSASDNLVGWINASRARNDWWIPNATSFTNNQHWPGTLTLTTEADETPRWQSKLNDANMAIGIL